MMLPFPWISSSNCIFSLMKALALPLYSSPQNSPLNIWPVAVLSLCHVLLSLSTFFGIFIQGCKSLKFLTGTVLILRGGDLKQKMGCAPLATLLLVLCTHHVLAYFPSCPSGSLHHLQTHRLNLGRQLLCCVTTCLLRICLKFLRYVLCKVTFLPLLCKVPVTNGIINNYRKMTGQVQATRCLMSRCGAILAGPFSSSREEKTPSTPGLIMQAGTQPEGGGGERYHSLPNSLMEEELH